MSTTTSNTNTPNGGSNIVNWVNSIDLSKYPELAQKVAAMNQVGLNYVESLILNAMQEAQSTFLNGSIDGGFGSAQSTIVYGGFEAGMGIAQAGAAGYQVKAAGENFSEIKGLETDRETERAGLIEAKKAEGASLEMQDPHSITDEDDSMDEGENLRAVREDEQIKPAKTGETYKKNGIDLSSQEEIRSKYDLKLEKAKAANNKQSAIGQIIQATAQFAQFPAQMAQANSQVGQTKQQAMNNNFSTAASATQAANQTLQSILQFDPYAQNVASSRA